MSSLPKLGLHALTPRQASPASDNMQKQTVLLPQHKGYREMAEDAAEHQVPHPPPPFPPSLQDLMLLSLYYDYVPVLHSEQSLNASVTVSTQGKQGPGASYAFVPLDTVQVY